MVAAAPQLVLQNEIIALRQMTSHRLNEAVRLLNHISFQIFYFSAISFTTPSSTTRIGRDSFAVMDSIPVQLNMFTLNLSNMPPTIERLHVDTIIICNNGTEINLNDGLVAVSGELVFP